MNRKEILSKFDGMDVEKFNRIKSISSYNSNYYEFDGELFYGKSDDDHQTEWWLLTGNRLPFFLGSSSMMDKPEIIVTDTV